MTLVTVETDVSWNVPEMVSVMELIVTVPVSKVIDLQPDKYICNCTHGICTSIKGYSTTANSTTSVTAFLVIVSKVIQLQLIQLQL